MIPSLPPRDDDLVRWFVRVDDLVLSGDGGMVAGSCGLGGGYAYPPSSSRTFFRACPCLAMEDLVATTKATAEEHLARAPTDLAPCKSMYDKAEQVLLDAAKRDAPDAAACLLKLWVNYASMLASMRQNKTAQVVFEKATACEYVRDEVGLWTSYATFFIRRDKANSARKVFVAGIKVLSTRTKRDQLWQAFLVHENRKRFTPLSMEELSEMVRPQGVAIETGQRLGVSTVVDPSFFLVPDEDLFFIADEEKKKTLPVLTEDTMMKLAAMFKVNPACLFEIVLRMQELEQLVSEDLRTQGKIFEQEIARGKMEVEDYEFPKMAGKEIRRTRRHMQSLLHNAGVPGIFLTEDRQQLLYQQKIISVVVDAAKLAAASAATAT